MRMYNVVASVKDRPMASLLTIGTCELLSISCQEANALNLDFGSPYFELRHDTEISKRACYKNAYDNSEYYATGRFRVQLRLDAE